MLKMTDNRSIKYWTDRQTLHLTCSDIFIIFPTSDPNIGKTSIEPGAKQYASLLTTLPLFTKAVLPDVRKRFERELSVPLIDIQTQAMTLWREVEDVLIAM